MISLTGAALAGVIAWNIAQDRTHFDCETVVSKLSMERVSKEKVIGFLEKPAENNPRVFIKDNENIELYAPSRNTNNYCSSELNAIGNKRKGQTQIHRKCEREFIPLKERTATLKDIKKYDSSENREKAAPAQKRYEERRKRIMSNKIKNQ